MAYFEKREIADKPGEFEYVEVEPSKVELPEDELAKRVVGHPKYRDVLDESKSRKERIRKMQDELKALEGEGDEPVKTEQAQGKQKQAEAPTPIDTEALYATFRERFIKDAQAEQQAKTEAEKRLLALAEQHGLSAGALPILANAADPEATAKLLEASQFRFDDQVGGAPSKPDGDALRANVFKSLGLEGD